MRAPNKTRVDSAAGGARESPRRHIALRCARRACGGNGASDTWSFAIMCVCSNTWTVPRVVPHSRNTSRECDWVRTVSSLQNAESTQSRYADLCCLYATGA
ncbi:hypothetical protein MRX96_055669 [Rhipicephalus microplus]